jgi:hypothetical protein
MRTVIALARTPALTFAVGAQLVVAVGGGFDISDAGAVAALDMTNLQKQPQP